MRSSGLRRSTFAVAVLLASAAALSGCGTKATSTSGSRGQTGTSFDVNVSRPRGGTITSVLPTGQPDGKIDCGTTATACGPATYAWDATVRFVATPDPSYKFMTWAADCIGTGPCTVDTKKTGADKWIAASFEPESWFPGLAFLVAVHRPTGGTIRSTDGRILCGSAAARCGPVMYDWTDGVTLTATADPGLAFQGWTGSCSANGTSETCALTSAAPADKLVGATFGGVGAAGGVVVSPEVPGLVVTVPPGALDTSTPVQVSLASVFEPPPPAVEVLSPVYKFEPEGTVFSDAVEVEIPVPPGHEGKKLGVFWKKRNRPGYDYIGGLLEDGKIKAKSLHFSDAFVGEEPATRTIQGVRFLSYLGAGNKIQNVPDADNLLESVEALVPSPGGGYTRYAGTAGLVDANGDGIPEADGTFAIEGVPHGTALVRIGVRFVETAENTISLTRLLYGRPDMIAIPYDPTGGSILPVTYALTNLEPWQSGDELHLFSPDADTLSLDTLPPGIVDGGTTLSGWRNLWNTPMYARHEIDGTGHGDVTFVTQMSGRTSPTGVRYLSLSRVLRTTTLDLASMPAATDPALFPSLVGAMGLAPLDQSISVDWNFGAFEAALVAAAPTSLPAAYGTLHVFGEPNALQYGVTSRTDKRIFFKLQVPQGTGLVSTGAMPFGGTPFEDRWGLYWMASVNRSVRVQPPPPPGQPAISFGFGVGIQVLGPIATTPSLLEPEITPVTNITVNGLPLDTPQPGVGLTPIIAWSPPSTGATVYTLFIDRLVRNPDGTVLERIAVVDTAGTAFEVPAGMLAAGQPYGVSIRAAKRGMDVTRPTRPQLPAAFATQASQWFTP